MPRGVFNWTYTDVANFLKKHSFRHIHTRGSHYYYTGFQNGEMRVVEDIISNSEQDFNIDIVAEI